MRYCVSYARLVGKIGSNRERNHATGPAELSTSDNDGLKTCIIGDFSDQLLHFLDAAENDIALEDRLTVNGGIGDRAEVKGITSDETGSYFWT